MSHTQQTKLDKYQGSALSGRRKKTTKLDLKTKDKKANNNKNVVHNFLCENEMEILKQDSVLAEEEEEEEEENSA